MKDDQLDHIIKAKLQNLQVDQRPMDWNVLEEKIKQSTNGGPANAGDQEFDQIIFERLNQFSASGLQKEKHWALFERQLHQLANFRERLLQYKLIEAILVSLLLLLTVELGFPTVSPTPFSQPAASKDLQAINSTTGEGSEEVTASATVGIENTAKETQTIVSKQADDKVALDISPNNGLVVTNQVELTSSSKPLLLVPVLEQDEVVAQKTTTLELSTDLNTVQQPNAFGPLAPIEATPSFLLNLGHQPNMQAQIQPLKRMNVQISMFGGIDYNEVMTPENSDKEINAFDRYSLGYRGGLIFDMGRVDGRLRLGSGLIYTAKQYEVGYQWITGNFLRSGGLTAEALDNIELNIVNLPVFARYDVIQSKRWSVFAHAGAAVQVVTQGNYYVNFPNLTPQGARINQTPSRYSQIDDRTGGFLEGGSFKDNSFFTGNMGLGLERHVADRWSLFMQSKYEYSIGYFSAGLGPTQDRINTMSFESGIRVNLK